MITYRPRTGLRAAAGLGAAVFVVACTGSPGAAASSAPGARSTTAPATHAARTSSGAPTTRGSAPSLRHLAISWRPRASGLDRPLQVASARDGSSRLFVVEQPGVIKVVRNGVVRSGSYLNISARVNSAGGEQGLLSVAFDPTFRAHPRLWVAYTRGDGALVIARFRAPSAGAGHVAASTGRTVLVVPHPVNTNHNGGQLWFGPDGMLYVGTGDGGSGGDPPNNAQNRKVLLGKMLRIDARHSCGQHRYCIPPGNPFAGKTAGTRRDLAVGPAQPLALELRPGHRRHVDRRRGAGRGRGDRPGPGEAGRPEPRLVVLGGARPLQHLTLPERHEVPVPGRDGQASEGGGDHWWLRLPGQQVPPVDGRRLRLR